MKINQQAILSLYVMTFVWVLSCSNTDAETRTNMTFDEYWYSGKAELTRYALQQARYGEIREGDAVLIFVTEPFLKDKQVKYEFGDDKDATSVLKLNFTRKFYTGVYPYSIMTSVFTPVALNELPTLKVTSSVQEWCGQTFMQFNHREDGYRVESRSYFQAEGDRTFSIDQTLLEDEIWTHIRIDPTSLPTGDVKIIPAAHHVRLKHVELKAEPATASLREIKNTELSPHPLYHYKVDYGELDRKLSLFFEKQLLHRILAWEETYKDGYGKNAAVLTTKAVRTHSMVLDYWSKNKLSDAHLRDELGIIY